MIYINYNTKTAPDPVIFKHRIREHWSYGPQQGYPANRFFSWHKDQTHLFSSVSPLLIYSAPFPVKVNRLFTASS